MRASWFLLLAVIVTMGSLGMWASRTGVVVRSAVAFFVAGLVAAVGVPLLLRLVGPGRRRGVHDSLPDVLTWRGAPLIVGTLIGVTVGHSLGSRTAVALVTAAAMGALALADGDERASPRLLALQLLGVAVMVALGVRFHINGDAVLDGLLTVLWIMGSVRALHGLDNMAGLTVSVVAPAGAALFVLAAFSGQDDIARLAASVAGVCVGSLWHNLRATRVFVSRSGAVFLGFLLCVMALEVEPALPAAASSAVPGLLLALPLLDLVMVTLGRLRRRLPVVGERLDHLPHRLVRRGISPPRTLILLMGAQALLSFLALLVGRGVSLVWCVGAGVLVMVAVTLPALAVSPYGEEVAGLPKSFRRVALAGLLVACALAIPALITVGEVRSEAQAGVQRARDALAAARGGDSLAAAASFNEAARLLSRAENRLEGPLPRLSLVIPVVSGNVRAARTVLDVGTELSLTGERLVGTMGSGVPVQSGSVPLDDLRRAASEIEHANDVVRTGHQRVRGAARAYLVPPLRDVVDQLEDTLSTAARPSALAAEAAGMASRLLGDQGPRRYLLAVQNGAELRGTGGFIGSFGELIAENGRLRLERIGRIGDLDYPSVREGEPPFPVPEEVARRYGHYGLDWRHVNVSPDFPTVGGIIADLYPRSGGRPIDGVIAADSLGLAAFLSVVGPVDVPGWPEPITVENVVRVTAHDSALDDRDRANFFGELTRAVWDKFASTRLPSMSSVLHALSQASRGRHLMLYFTRAEEQALMSKAGITGEVPGWRSDSLMVVTNNLAGNKLDYYLSRNVRYEVALAPGKNTARVSGRVEVTLGNAGPASGLPVAIIGPAGPRFDAGENVSLLTVHTPHKLLTSTVGDEPAQLRSDRELGRLAHEHPFFSVPSGQQTTLKLDLSGRVAVEPGGWYYLDVIKQPTLYPDGVEVSVRVPSGWRIAEAVGFEVRTPSEAVLRTAMDQDLTVGVRLERTGVTGWPQRLRWPPGTSAAESSTTDPEP